MRALTSKKICVSVRWVTLWVRPHPPCENMCVHSLGYIVGVSPPLWKYVCPFVGLHCGCVPPSWVSFHWKTIFLGFLHAAYSTLRHFCTTNVFEPKILLNPNFFLNQNGLRFKFFVDSNCSTRSYISSKWKFIPKLNQHQNWHKTEFHFCVESHLFFSTL